MVLIFYNMLHDNSTSYNLNSKLEYCRDFISKHNVFRNKNNVAVVDMFVKNLIYLKLLIFLVRYLKKKVLLLIWPASLYFIFNFSKLNIFSELETSKLKLLRILLLKKYEKKSINMVAFQNLILKYSAYAIFKLFN